jgi:hypothetical protein
MLHLLPPWYMTFPCAAAMPLATTPYPPTYNRPTTARLHLPTVPWKPYPHPPPPLLQSPSSTLTTHPPPTHPCHPATLSSHSLLHGCRSPQSRATSPLYGPHTAPVGARASADSAHVQLMLRLLRGTGRLQLLKELPPAPLLPLLLLLMLLESSQVFRRVPQGVVRATCPGAAGRAQQRWQHMEQRCSWR